MCCEKARRKHIPLHNEFIQVGNLNKHISHKPYVYKGVRYCINCGCYATNKLKKLASKCAVRTLVGQRFLNNLDNGVLLASANIDLHLTHLEQIALNNFQNQVDQRSNSGNTVDDIDIIHDNDLVLESEFPLESPLIGLHSDSD